MNEMGAVCEVKQSRFQRLRWQIGRKTWPITSKVAWWLYRLSHWAMETKPRYCPKVVWQFFSGLGEGAWIHVCGYDLPYCFHIAWIYWSPFKRKLLADFPTVKL
jgi:hypothetical protein